MNNQNIISNKFDLFWTTLFSYILNVIMLNVIMLSVIRLSVVALFFLW
jgi:hypothetical protein